MMILWKQLLSWCKMWDLVFLETCVQVKKQQNWTCNNELVQNWKRVHQGCILSPCLFNLYVECCVYVCAQLCLTLCNPKDSRPSGSSVHGIFQAIILEWVAFSYSRGSIPPRNQTHVSYISCIGLPSVIFDSSKENLFS